jgi:dienelactone hydrolase
MRFLWSMRPTGPGSVICCFGAPIAGRNAVTLSVTSGGRQLARTSLSRRITPASVRVGHLSVAHDGIYGYEFTPAGGARRPGVLVIGGSEGGDGVGVVEAAGLLAAHGYPTLALAYFKEPGLPSALERISLEYFARALRVLRRQPDVDPAHLVVMGSSRGGEAALLIASTFPTLVHGAIALVPNVNIGPSLPLGSSVPAWTYRGQALAPGTPIPLGRIDGPIMAVGGGLDNVWDSPTYVQEIQQRLRDSHFRFDDTSLVYPQAGHNIGVPVPYLPQPIEQSFFGGTAGGDAAAKADLWPRILRYLSQLTQSMPKG